MLLGAIGSGKYPSIVTENYIHESFKRKRFLREDPYIPKTIKKIQNSYRENGLVFQNQTVMVLMRDFRKQMELKTIGKKHAHSSKNFPNLNFPPNQKPPFDLQKPLVI